MIPLSWNSDFLMVCSVLVERSHGWSQDLVTRSPAPSKEDHNAKEGSKHVFINMQGKKSKKVMIQPRLERETFCVLGKRDNQLHHRTRIQADKHVKAQKKL